jgi:hypothetical protein
VKLKRPLDILYGFNHDCRFDSHGEERAEEENGSAPNLRVSETFAKNPGGECQCAGGTKKLERLRERNTDLVDGHVVQDMCERNAANGRDNKNEVNVPSRMKRSANFAKHTGERE